MESLREPAYESMNNRKITVTHEFTSLTDYANEYTNRSTFAITDQTTEIGVYFKVSFEPFAQPSFHLLGQRKPLRSRHADRQRGLGTVGARRQRGRQPARGSASSNPSFAQGDWELDIKHVVVVKAPWDRFETTL